MKTQALTVAMAERAVREIEAKDLTVPLHREELTKARLALDQARRDRAELESQIRVGVATSGVVTLTFTSRAAAKQHLAASAQYYAARVKEIDGEFGETLFPVDEAVEVNRRAKAAAAALREIVKKEVEHG